MAQFDRDTYEPDDEMRVYDDAEDEDSEGSRLPLLIVLALVVLAMFLGLVWLAYNEGVARGRGEVPVLAAQAGPVRVAPRNPGGFEQPYKGFKIYEQPAPPDDAGDQAGAAKAAAPAAKSTAAAPAPEKPAAQQAATHPAATSPQPAPAQSEKPSPHAAAKAVAPSATSQTRATSSARNQVATTGAPRALGRPQPSAANTAAGAPAETNPGDGTAGGAYVLQIGAYQSAADAQSAWNLYKSRQGALLQGYSPNIQRADLGAKGVWYRLRITGFANRDVAAALCERLKVNGGRCFLSH